MFLLHIGRNKTGTTSVQHFLAQNRAALATQGVDYPCIDRPGADRSCHHVLAEWLRSFGEDVPAEGELRERLFRTFPELEESYERALGCERALLLSSEAFQELPPALVAAVFPPPSTRVLVYLREQVDYVVSSWAQEIHANLETRTLAEYLEAQKPDYGAFVHAWLREFGSDRVTVRDYSRRRLEHGDVRTDVLSWLGVRRETVHFEPSDTNPSLGGGLLSIKRSLNLLLDVDAATARVALYLPLRDLALARASFRARPTIDVGQQARLRAEYAVHNARLRATVGFPPFDVVDLSSPDPAAGDRYTVEELDFVMRTLDRTSGEFFERYVRPHEPALRVRASDGS